MPGPYTPGLQILKDSGRLAVPAGSPFTILDRATSRTGGGALSPVPAEGNLLVPADVTTITVNIYDPTGANPGTPVYTASPNPNTVLQTTLQTTGIWQGIPDGQGGNFLLNIPAAACTLPNHYYVITIELLSGMTVMGWGQADIKTQALGVT